MQLGGSKGCGFEDGRHPCQQGNKARFSEPIRTCNSPTNYNIQCGRRRGHIIGRTRSAGRSIMGCLAIQRLPRFHGELPLVSDATESRFKFCSNPGLHYLFVVACQNQNQRNKQIESCHGNIHVHSMEHSGLPGIPLLGIWKLVKSNRIQGPSIFLFWIDAVLTCTKQL